MIFLGDNWFGSQTVASTQGHQLLGNLMQTSTTSITTQINCSTIFHQWVQRNQTANATSIWTSWADDDTYNERSLAEHERQRALVEQRRALDVLDRKETEFRERKRREVTERAEGLLLSHLTPAQRADYLRNKWFVVDGHNGARFRVHADRGVHGNVVRLEGEREVERLCFRIKDELQCPHEDHLLTQKFMLEHHYEEVLRTAGRVRLAA